MFSSFANLAGVSCQEELISILKARPIESWLVGVRFNQESTKEKSMPDRCFLDKAFGQVPVVIFRTCLHLVVANTTAMEKLGRRSENGFFYEADVFAILNQLPALLRIQPEIIVRNGMAKLERLEIKKAIDMGMDFNRRSFLMRCSFTPRT